MRTRRLRRAISCILRGAAATVAVAWAAAMFTKLEYGTAPVLKAWPAGVPAGWPTAVVAVCFEGLGLHGESRMTIEVGAAHYYEAHSIFAGWPWGALGATRFETISPSSHSPLGKMPSAAWNEGLMDLPDLYARDALPGRRLPIKVLPAGFVGDTLVFAAAAWGLFVGPSQLRRWYRKRTGRCPGCGYDMRGLAADAACPECGPASVPASPAER